MKDSALTFSNGIIYLGMHFIHITQLTSEFYYVHILFTFKYYNHKAIKVLTSGLQDWQNLNQLTRESERLQITFSTTCFPLELVFNWAALHVEWVPHLQPFIKSGQAMLILLMVLLVEEGRAFRCMQTLTLYSVSFPVSCAMLAV